MPFLFGHNSAIVRPYKLSSKGRGSLKKEAVLSTRKEQTQCLLFAPLLPSNFKLAVDGRRRGGLSVAAHKVGFAPARQQLVRCFSAMIVLARLGSRKLLPHLREKPESERQSVG
jgi:hypothetical protein